MHYFRSKKNGKRKSGQSFVEFILTLFAFLTVTFMFVQVALSFGVGNYIQYATYLSARAYLAGYDLDSQQKKAAQTYMQEFLMPGGSDVFRNIAKAVEGGNTDMPGVFIGGPRLVAEASDTARYKNWEQGVTYTFKSRLYMIPILKSQAAGLGNNIELESQSWLGREPTADDCQRYLMKRQQSKNIKGAMLVDNGC